MLNFLKIFIFPLLIFIVTGGPAVAQNDIKKYRDIYTFNYPEKDSVLINKLMEKADPGITAIENFFGLKPGISFQIYLTRSQAEFQSYSASGFPEWAQAIAFVNKRMIVLRAGSGDEVLRLPQVFLHELVHVYLGLIAPRQHIPTWLHEGLAQYLSHEGLTMDEQVLIANALYSDRISYLADLDSMFAFSPLKARLGYALARSSVDYFIQQYNLKTLLLTLQALDNQPLNKAFLQATGRDFVDFETGWFTYIDDKYSWMFLINAENFVWAILVLLFVTAFIRIKLKNRKTRDSWQDEIESNDFLN